VPYLNQFVKQNITVIKMCIVVVVILRNDRSLTEDCFRLTLSFIFCTI